MLQMLSKVKKEFGERELNLYRALAFLGVWNFQIEVAVNFDVDGGVGDVYHLEVVVHQEKAGQFGRVA